MTPEDEARYGHQYKIDNYFKNTTHCPLHKKTILRYLDSKPYCVDCDARAGERVDGHNCCFAFCYKWGYNCGERGCNKPHKFKIGERVRSGNSNRVGVVVRYHQQKPGQLRGNQKCQTVLWDNGKSGASLDHYLQKECMRRATISYKKGELCECENQPV